MSRYEEKLNESLDLEDSVTIVKKVRARMGNSGARLLIALEQQPKPPCVDRGDGKPCEFFYRCAVEKLACKAFYAYTRAPEIGKEYREWRTMERLPSASRYRKTYKETE